VRPFFHHSAPINHNDLVRIADSAQPAEGGEEVRQYYRSEVATEKGVEKAASICGTGIMSYL
jgi:hypothetical protein